MLSPRPQLRGVTFLNQPEVQGQVQQPTQLQPPDITPVLQQIAVARQQLGQAGEAAQAGASQVAAAQSTANQRASEAAGVSDVVRQPRSNGALGEAIRGALTVYQDYDKRRREYEAKLLEEQRAQNAIEFRRDAERLRVEAPAVHMTPGGAPAYERDVTALIQNYRQRVDPDIIASALDNLYEYPRSRTRDEAAAHINAMEEAQDAAINAKILRFNVEFQPLLQRIANSTDPDRIAADTEDAFQLYIAASSTATNDVERMLILQAGSEQIAEMTSRGYAGVEVLQNRINNASEGYSIASELLAAFQESPQSVQDRLLYENGVRMLEVRYGIQLDTDPLAVDQQALAWNATLQGLQESSRDFEHDVDYDAVITAQNIGVGGLIQLALANPSKFAAYETELRQLGVLDDSSFVTEAREASQLISGYNEKIRPLQLDLTALNRSLITLREGNLEQAITWLQDEQNVELVERLGLRGQLDDFINRAAPGNTTTGTYAQRVAQIASNDVNRAQLQALWQQNRTLFVDQIQEEATIVNNQINDAYAAISPYEESGLFTRRPDGSIQVNRTLAQEDIDRITGTLTETQKLIEEQRRAAQPAAIQGNTPNFNRPQLATVQTAAGVSIPVPVLAGTQGVAYTSARQPDRGGTPHAGADFAMPNNTPLIAYVGGTVVHSGPQPDGGGYGNYITWRGDDGRFHRFAHMNRLDFEEGDRIEAGQVVGLSGDTGDSTGPHLHWEIRTANNFGYSNTLDVVSEANSIQQGYRSARAAERTPGRPPNAVQLSTGMFVYNDTVFDAQGNATTARYSASNPIQTQYAPFDQASYGANDIERNYGYARLANDRDARMALVAVSNELGIPAQWLADVIDFESGWIKSRDNGLGYQGLIQFGAPAMRAAGINPQWLRNNSTADQLRGPVLSYLSEFKGRLRSPAHVLMAVWGGGGHFRNMDQNGYESVRNLNDYAAGGNIIFHQYIDRLGEGAGRRYNHPYLPPATVHTSYVRTCSMCQNIQASGSSVANFPHQFRGN